MPMIIALLMMFETTFMDAQAKYRSTLDAITHRKMESVSVVRQT